MSDQFILTLEDAALANVNYGMSLTDESLIINRLSATVIHLYKKLNSESRYYLDEKVIAEAIQSELDWLELRHCNYAAEAVVTAIKKNNEGV